MHFDTGRLLKIASIYYLRICAMVKHAVFAARALVGANSKIRDSAK